MNKDVLDNISKHERIATEYDSRHPEIYNEIEQDRLRNSLQFLRSLVSSQTPRALDYGCGTGNVTRHLLTLGFDVEAADVTPKFVEMVTEEHRQSGRVSGRILNGRNLDGCPSNSFDVITVYSVLHHIPDYIEALIDMVRVLKPGGVLFLDHEFAPEYWAPSNALSAIRSRTHQRTPISKHLKSLLSPAWYVKRYRKTLNPRYQEEGDIHVWPDDHIDWDLIRSSLANEMELVRVTDYLYYQEHYPVDLFREYQHQCADLREMILRRRR